MWVGGVHFCETNGEYIGTFEIEAVKKALRKIRKVRDQFFIDNEEEYLDENDQKCIEMLKPYFCPEKKKNKSQKGLAGLKNKLMDLLRAKA